MKATNKNKTRMLLPFHIIAEAVKGNPIAIEEVMKHFDDYITKLSTVKITNEYGNKYSYVDESIRRRLEIKLITAIVTKFRLEIV